MWGGVKDLKIQVNNHVNRDLDVENRQVDTVEGEGGTRWESSTDRYTPTCVKQIASGEVLYSTGTSVRCSVMT